MRKLVTMMLLAGFITLGLWTCSSYAGEIDILLQKLVEKGVLTPGEAQQIGTETKEQVKAEIAEGTYSSLPAWVQNTKLKGDFRVRYQYDHAKKLPDSSQSPREDQQRGRLRLRMGLESKVNDKLLVAFGLATGLNSGISTTDKDTSRSPNQTFGAGFGKKPISIDYAYAQYSPVSWATLIGGRMKNPLWEPGDLIWDTDINPEGGVVKLNKKLFPGLLPNSEFFLTGGTLIIDEASTDEADPTMFVLQSGINQKLTDTVSLKGAISYYGFTGVKNKVLAGNVGTNTNTTGSSTGALRNGYKNITPALELTVNSPFKALNVPALDIPYLALFAEYVKNIEPSVKARDTGYMVGCKFGNEKIEKWADWQFRYNYAMLGKDAILDILPDSDRYGGKTGIRAHEAMFDWGVGKNTWLGLDYYYGWQIPGSAGLTGSTQTKPASVLQLDWNMKF